MPKINKEVVTVKEFAARLGVSAQAVMRYMNNGIITERSIAYMKEGGKPKIVVESALEEIKKNKDPTKSRSTRTGKTVAGLTAPKVRGTLKAPKVKEAQAFAEQIVKAKGDSVYDNGGEKITVDGIEIDFSKDPASLIEAKIRQEIAKANEAEIKVKALRGTYVEIAKQDAQLANLAVNLKKDIANVPDRLAAPLAAETNPATVRNMIHAELEAILVKHSGPRKIWRT